MAREASNSKSVTDDDVSRDVCRLPSGTHGAIRSMRYWSVSAQHENCALPVSAVHASICCARLGTAPIA